MPCGPTTPSRTRPRPKSLWGYLYILDLTICYRYYSCIISFLIDCCGAARHPRSHRSGFGTGAACVVSQIPTADAGLSYRADRVSSAGSSSSQPPGPRPVARLPSSRFRFSLRSGSLRSRSRRDPSRRDELRLSLSSLPY